MRVPLDPHTPVRSYPCTGIAPNDYLIDAKANCCLLTRVRPWEVNRTSERKKLEEIFTKHSFTDFKWVDAQKIVVSQWVRLKCMFGCAEYGKRASCPPNVPTVTECERFFRDYKEAAVFHFEKAVAKPEDRYAWTRGVNAKLWKLERDVFVAGYPKAFLLYMDTCYLCKDCSGTRAECLNKKLARPTPEALAVDVYSTVKQVGYPIQVLSDYSQKMNRYAFLMIK